MKVGYKTTEFWLSALAVLIGLVAASGALDPLGADHWAVRVVGLVAAALTTLGYTASRAKVKTEAE